jgi:signal transduction histidine kinase
LRANYTFLICFQNLVFAQKTLVLKENTKEINLKKEYFTVFEDKSTLMTFEQVRDQEYKNHNSNTFNFGFSSSKYWIKIPIVNQSDQNWIMAVMASLVDELELYTVLADGSVTKKVSGDKYPHSQREFDLPMFAFSIKPPQNQVTTLYLSAKSLDTKQFTVKFEDPTVFSKVEHNYISLWFFYFGLLFMMVVYNLFLYFSIFEKAYLFYVFYILNFIFAQLTLLGFGNQYIWGNYVWFANRTPVFFAATTSIFALLFAIRFLNVYQYYPKSKIYFNILLGINILLCILTIIKPTILYNRISSYMIIVQVAIVVIIGVGVMRKGYAPARYYMLSWAVLFVALILFALKIMGLLPLTTINYTLLPTGAAIEVLMLSLGLGNRINTTQNEKTEAQKELVNQLLENEQVKSRIARDLHDDLGSTLSSIRILSEYAKNQAINDPSQTESLLKKISESSQKLQENLQDIVWTTQSKDNTLHELSTRMRRFGGEILEAKNINYAIHIDKNLDLLNLSSAIQYDIFMIFKESINNIVKYAEAKNVWVRFIYLNDILTLEIRDDGIGFDSTQEKDGNGLKNMAKRAENIKGKLIILSKLNEGTTILLETTVTQ